MELGSDLSVAWERDFTFGLEPLAAYSLVEASDDTFALCGSVSNDALFLTFQVISNVYTPFEQIRIVSNTGNRIVCNHIIANKVTEVVHFVGRI